MKSAPWPRDLIPTIMDASYAAYFDKDGLCYRKASTVHNVSIYVDKIDGDTLVYLTADVSMVGP